MKAPRNASPSAPRAILGLALLVLLTAAPLRAQHEPATIADTPPNAAHVGLGLGFLYFTAAVHYERVLWAIPSQKPVFPFLRASYGGYALWGIGGQFASLRGGVIMGQRSSHLELYGGLSAFLSGDLHDPRAPLGGGIAYRYQKPGKRFLFRTSLSWPEALALGVGFGF